MSYDHLLLIQLKISTQKTATSHDMELRARNGWKGGRRVPSKRGLGPFTQFPSIWLDPFKQRWPYTICTRAGLYIMIWVWTLECLKNSLRGTKGSLGELWSADWASVVTLMDKQHAAQTTSSRSFDGQATRIRSSTSCTSNRSSRSSGFDGQATSSRSSGSATPLYRWQVLCGKKQVAPPADKKDGLTFTLVSESWWLLW